MRIGMVETKDGPVAAVAVDGAAVDLHAAAHADTTDFAKRFDGDPTLDRLLRDWPAAEPWARRQASGGEHRIKNPKWRQPLSRPQKICGIGLNYRDHCAEQGLEPPKSPILFAKFPSTLIGPGDAIQFDPKFSSAIDFEAELGVVIGTPARRVPKDRAYDHVAGYVCANDVTARDIQKGDGQFVRGKSLDTFCPLGPYLVTRDEVHDPHDLKIRCRVNGKTMQDSNTSNLIFGVDHLVSFLSQAFTLLPGDVILTGTPGGVGMYRTPPAYLKDGDRVEVEIAGLGVLQNTVKAPS